MPDFYYNVIRSQCRDTALTPSGRGLPGGTPIPIPNGPVIPDDKVRYVWRIRAINPTDNPSVLVVFAGDVANLARRELIRIPILPNTTLNYPEKACFDRPILRVEPNTSVSPTQENQLACSDDTATGSVIQGISMSYYDKRG